jgi:hypothetical protein
MCPSNACMPAQINDYTSSQCASLNSRNSSTDGLQYRQQVRHLSGCVHHAGWPAPTQYRKSRHAANMKAVRVVQAG